MKASGKMANSKVEVRKKWLIYDLFILTLFDDSIGEWFGNNGNRYEGEFKNCLMHGLGK